MHSFFDRKEQDGKEQEKGPWVTVQEESSSKTTSSSSSFREISPARYQRSRGKGLRLYISKTKRINLSSKK